MPHDDSLLTLLYLMLSNMVFMTILVCLSLYYMIGHGYKSISIKFKKNKKSKSAEKINEEKYLARLEKNIKKKK